MLICWCWSMSTSFSVCWNMRLSSSGELNNYSSPQSSTSSYRVIISNCGEKFPKKHNSCTESLRCSHVKWAKWGHVQGYIKSLWGIPLIAVKQKGEGFSWEILVFYWDFCTGLSEWQMWMDIYYLSDGTVDVTKQYSKRIRTSRTLSLVLTMLTSFWPCGRKLRIKVWIRADGFYC